MHKIYALFNKKTRQLTCFTFDLSSFPHILLDSMLIREYTFSELGINDNEINLTRFKWIGDYDTGRLVDIVTEKKAVVTEREIDEKYSTMFWSKYSLQEVVFELLLNSTMSSETGKAMQAFLEKVQNKKHKDKEFFKSSPIHIWETDETIKQRQKDAFK